MPKIDIAGAPVTLGSDYPAPYAAAFTGRLRRRLGDAAGLKTIGVNLTTLPPGDASSLRHWHEVEDEMVFVLEGEIVLVEETGETPLGPGEAAGFPAGAANGHRLVNRSGRSALILEMGTRPTRDRCHYPDADLIWHDDGETSWFTRHDGTPIAGEDGA